MGIRETYDLHGRNNCDSMNLIVGDRQILLYLDSFG